MPSILSRHLQTVVFWLSVVISLLHLYFNTIGTLPNLWQSALHFAGLSLLCALLYPVFWSEKQGTSAAFLFVIEIGFALLIAFAGLFMVASEDAIYARGMQLTTAEWFFGIVLILGAIEYTRRTTGWIIPILILLALSYVAWWGAWLENVFHFSGLRFETLIFRSIFGDDALFGNIARISSTFVFLFILFGAFLLRSGGGDFIIDLARCLAGRLIGGPGIVAVMASGMTATISGSAVANTVSTGVITIPLMRRAGFPPTFAAGVEAAASTGGQLMPPIMGAGAFIMATYTQIPYQQIALVSLLPALLYFFSMIILVRIEAKRLQLQPISETADTPKLSDVLKRGGLVFLLPIGVLMGLLIAGFTPTYAAGIAILAVIMASWLTPNRMGFRAILDALALGARNMVTTAMLLVAIGLIVNVITLTGLGNTLSYLIQDWAGNSLLLALALVALASLVLGMGLPVTAAYIVLATLSAPALYSLIVQSHLVTALTSGIDLSPATQALLTLATPELLPPDGQPWTEANAYALLTSLRQLDPSLLAGLYEQVLPSAQLTTALLAAHLIIFWLSQDSNVTPPVCLTAFAAAAIAKASPMQTGVAAWKIAKGLYLLPLLFAYTALIGGTPVQLLDIGLSTAVAFYALAGAWQGHLEFALHWQQRSLLLGAAILLLWPNLFWLHLAGFALFLLVFRWHWAKTSS